jgi:hypothetical protein
MAAGAGGAADEHRSFDRRFTVAAAAVVVALGLGSFALVRRADSQAAKHSRPGDACPIHGSRHNGDQALDGVVAFDRSTGEVLWENVVPVGSVLGSRHGDLVVVRDEGGPARVIDPRDGAITSCGARTDDVVASTSTAEPQEGARFELHGLAIEAAGDGADVRAIGSDGSELWAVDAGNPAVGGRATVSHPVHAAALASDGAIVVVLTSATLSDPD